MNLSLSKIQHSKFASQETACYEAVLNLDGKKVANMRNDGHGGCDIVHWTDRAAQAKIEAYFAGLPKMRSSDMDLQPCLELWTAKQIELANIYKSVKRSLAKKTVFVHGGQEFSIKQDPKYLDITMNGKPTLREAIMKRYAGAVVLNGLSEADLRQQVEIIYDKAAA